MKPERIVKFCKKKIKEEEAKASFSSSRIEALNEVVNFIENADAAKENELDKIKVVWEKYYNLQVQWATKTTKQVHYTFTKTDESYIKRKIIPFLKEEMGNNEDHFGEMSVSDFFDFFIKNMPSWWKTNAFSISSISRHMPKIYMQIINSNADKMDTGSKKATMDNVMKDIKLDFSNISDE